MRGTDDHRRRALSRPVNAVRTVLLPGGGRVCRSGHGDVRVSSRDDAVRERVLPKGRGLRSRCHVDVCRPRCRVHRLRHRLRQHVLRCGHGVQREHLLQDRRRNVRFHGAVLRFPHVPERSLLCRCGRGVHGERQLLRFADLSGRGVLQRKTLYVLYACRLL